MKIKHFKRLTALSKLQVYGNSSQYGITGPTFEQTTSPKLSRSQTTSGVVFAPDCTSLSGKLRAQLIYSCAYLDRLEATGIMKSPEKCRLFAELISNRGPRNKHIQITLTYYRSARNEIRQVGQLECGILSYNVS